MTNEEINKAIAEACGWKCGYTEKSGYYVVDPNGFQRGWSKLECVAISALPNYCADLNTMHEAEKTLNKDQFMLYCDNLWPLGNGVWEAIHATASQRAEAFVKALGKWEEAK